MRTASRTAEHVALFRALETRRRDRLFTDDLAARFLPPGYRLLSYAAAVPPLGRAIARLIDRMHPAGPRTSAAVRTRLIDDLVAEAAPAQVLLLGAGYDSRAHRLDLPVTYEVDHPATQAVKRHKVAQVPNVRYVPVDLNVDDLTGALTAAGFPRVRTAVVWEGVTNYLTDEAVDATLRALVTITAPGSTVIFTYVDRAALDGDLPGLAAWHGMVTKVGEPWTFGFDPAEVPAYVRERGLSLGGDLSAREAAARYHRDEPAADFYRIAWAVVD